MQDLNDPTSILTSFPGFDGNLNEAVSLEDLLKNQIIIAGELQKIIRQQGSHLDPKELKDLVQTSSTVVAAAYKAGESLRALSTYRTFVEVVLEFLKRRSDTLGDDLLAELLSTARDLRAEGVVRGMIG